MMSNTEQHNFREQIETSIDSQLSQLEEELDSLHGKVEGVKESIMNEIQDEFLVDGSIDKEELMKIYQAFAPKNFQILQELSIQGFEDFLIFLGIDIDSQEIEHVDTLENITINGTQVDFIPPVGITKKVEENYFEVFMMIQQNDVSRFIDESTVFIATSPISIDFFIYNTDGKKIFYTVNPEGVFEINMDSDHSKKGEVIQMQIQIYQFSNKILAQLKNDPDLDEDEKRLIWNFIYFPYLIEQVAEEIHPKYKKAIEEYSLLVQEQKKINGVVYSKTLISEDRKIIHITSINLYNTIIRIGDIDTEVTYTQGYKEKEKRGDTTTHFKRDGSISSIVRVDSHGVFKEQEVYYPNGNIRYTRKGGNIFFRDEHSGELIYKYEKGILTLVGNNGTEVQDFKSMQEKNKHLTENDYLNFLAKSLDTPQKIHLFFELFMSYTHDDDSNKNTDIAQPNIGGRDDYWNTPEETLNKVLMGQMLGDCDDYAFLAKEILRRQGKNAQVMGIPRHAIALWTNQNPDGTLNAYTIGTFGYDKNGNRYGMGSDPEKENGYATLQEAINSVMVKYDEADLGLEEGVNYRIINEKIGILRIPREGKRGHGRGSGGLGDGTIPIGLLNKQGLLDKVLTARNYIDLEKYNVGLSVLESLLEEHPEHADFLHDETISTLKKIVSDMGFGTHTRQDIEMGFGSILTRYIRIYPQKARYREILADFLEKSGDSDRVNSYSSEYHEEEAVKIGSSDYYLISKYAGEAEKTGDIDSAIEYWKLGIEKIRKPEYKDMAYIELAGIYIRSGKIELAKSVLKSQPKSWRNNIYVSYIYYKHDSDPEKAIQYFIQNTESNGSTSLEMRASYYEGLGIVSVEVGESKSTVNKDNTEYTPELLERTPDLASFMQKRIGILEQILYEKDYLVNHRIYTLANLYYSVGEIDKSLAIFDAIISNTDELKEKLDAKVRQIFYLLKEGRIEDSSKIIGHHEHVSHIIQELQRIGVEGPKIEVLLKSNITTFPNEKNYVAYYFFLKNKDSKDTFDFLKKAFLKFPHNSQLASEYDRYFNE